MPACHTSRFLADNSRHKDGGMRNPVANLGTTSTATTRGGGKWTEVGALQSISSMKPLYSFEKVSFQVFAIITALHWNSVLVGKVNW